MCISSQFLGDISGFASDIVPSHLLFNALKGSLYSSPPAQPDAKAPDYLPPSKLICFLADLSQV